MADLLSQLAVSSPADWVSSPRISSTEAAKELVDELYKLFAEAM